MNRLLRFLREEDGPTAVEYAVMLALILLACIATISLMGSETNSSFSHAHQKIQDAMTAGS